MTPTPLDWNPFDRTNAIGDPGRQPEIRATGGALTVGVPDTVLDFLSVDDFEVRGCSTRGWSHRYKGAPRQDSFSLLANDDIVVVAVADGVSEGDFSQVAAETASRSACKLAADQFAKNAAIDWVQLGRRISVRIVEEAEYRQISHPDGDDPSIDERIRSCLTKMSTTLIVAVVQRVPRHDGFAVEIGVVAGDSAAYMHRVGDDVLVPVGGGKTSVGPITSTRVRPLPGTVEPEVAELVLRPGEALILGSDGIGDPLGDGTGEVGLELARRWQEPPTVDRFLLDLNVYRRSFDDDRTAVGLWLRPDATLPEAPNADPEPPSAGITATAPELLEPPIADDRESEDELRSETVPTGTTSTEPGGTEPVSGQPTGAVDADG